MIDPKPPSRKKKDAPRKLAQKPSRSNLQRAFDLAWLAQQLPSATSVDELLVDYNERVVGARRQLLLAQNANMDPDEAQRIAARQAISRERLERDIATLQRAAEEHAIAAARDGWLAEAIAATEANRQRLRHIAGLALEEWRRQPPGERNPQLLAIAAAAVPAESKLLAELLGYHGMQQVQAIEIPVGTAKELAESGGDAALIVKFAQADPRLANQAVQVLGRLLELARRAEVAKGGGPKIAGGGDTRPPLAVLWGKKVIGGEAEGGGN